MGKDPAATSPPRFPRAALVALLVAEVLFFSLHFDLASLVNLLDVGPATNIERYLSRVLCVALVAVVFVGSRLRREVEPRADAVRQFLRSWLLMLVQVAAFLAFVWLTTFICTDGEAFAQHPARWTIAWAALGLSVVGLGVAPLLPADLWALLLRHRADLSAAAAIGFAAVLAGWLTAPLWEPLSRSTLWCVHQALLWRYEDVVYRPEESAVGTPTCEVVIAGECGGYQGIGLNVVFLMTYCWLFRRDLRFPQVLVLFPIGAVLMWLANLLRLVALIALGTEVSLEVALEGFHSNAGWLAFTAVSLGLVYVAGRLQFFTAADPLRQAPGAQNQAAAYLAPLLAIVATMMLTGAFSTGFDWFYPVRVLTAAAALWFFRGHYPTWQWAWSWPAFAIGVTVFVLWIGLEFFSPTGVETPMPSELASLPKAWATAWLVFRVAGSVVTVPVAEELAFRGYLTRRLQAADFQEVPLGQLTWFSFLASSVLFGAMHGRWFAGTLAGMFYAVALYRRGRLSEAVQAHAVTNALIAASVLGLGAWSLWER